MNHRIHNEEISQAKARVAISFLCCVVYIGLYLFDKTSSTPIIFLFTCLIFSSIWLVYLNKYQQNNVWRRRFISAFDISVVSFAMFTSGEWGAIFYFLYLWVIVGNGMRFGLRSLTEVMILGVIGFSVLLTYSDYWQQNLPAGTGLLLGIIILPCFYMVLIKRLHSLNEQLKIQLEKSTYAATHDGMTKLPNRDYFFRQVSNKILNAKENTNHFSILFIDIDGFKTINDNYGHRYGDELLITLSHRMKNLIRKGDLIARLGGDEFAVVICNANRDGSQNIAQRILQEVEKCVVVDNIELHVTASVGISCYPEHGKNADSILQAADTAMYKSKHHGKNCITQYRIDMVA